MPTITRNALIGLVTGVALIAAACASPSPEPATATPTRTVEATPTSTATPARTPSPTASPTPTATSMPGGPQSATTPPSGYAQSCAKDVPWGKQVTKPMLCLDGPAVGTKVARGGRVTVQGYAGGSFESNVVVEVSALVDRAPSGTLVKTALTYGAPDIGMPGAFEVTFTIPASAVPGPTRVTAHFDSPRDGSIVMSASVDIVVE